MLVPPQVGETFEGTMSLVQQEVVYASGPA